MKLCTVEVGFINQAGRPRSLHPGWVAEGVGGPRGGRWSMDHFLWSFGYRPGGHQTALQGGKGEDEMCGMIVDDGSASKMHVFGLIFFFKFFLWI